MICLKNSVFHINTLSGLGILMALWYWGHPYFGIFHDARLYTGQALAYLNPKPYTNDLFFLYGSHNKYTIFNFGYAQAIEYLGLNHAVAWLTFFGLALWFCCSVVLLTTLAKDWVFWLALSLITLLPGGYGSGYIFEYAEDFLTPRLYAEALVLLSISLALNERWKLMASVLILACAIHPLMSLPALLLILFYQRHLLKLSLVSLILIGGLGLILAYLQIEPFSRILQVMDDEWYRLAMDRSPHLTMTSWKTVDWMVIQINFCVLIAAWRVATGKLERLFFSIMITTAVALLICAAGDLIWRNVLIIQLQLWRVLWLTQWLSYFALAWLIGNHWQTSSFSRLIILILISAWLIREHTGALIAVLALGVWYWQVPQTLTPPINRLWVIGGYLIFGQALFWFLLNIDIDYVMIRGYFSGAEEWAYRLHRIGEGVVLIPLLWLIRWLVIPKLKFQGYRQLLLISAGVAMMMSLWMWNKLQPELFPKDRTIVESFSEFRKHIPESAVVYWRGDHEVEPLLNCWLLIERACYLSKAQAAGIVFNRATAIEAKRRSLNVLPLSIQDSFVMSNSMPAEASYSQKKSERADLTNVCQDPHLDFVVLTEAINGVSSLAQQHLIATKINYYLYACNPLRSNS